MNDLNIYRRNVERITIDRQGREVFIKQLSDTRWLFVFQDGYLERREILKIGLDK